MKARTALRVAALALGVPLAVVAQEVPSKVRVVLHVTSEGGEGLRGGQVEVRPWSGSGSGVFVLGEGGETPNVFLEPGREYSITIRAPAHETHRLSLDLRAEPEVQRLRVVLKLDPYVLPEVRALAGPTDAWARAGSVSRIDFGGEPVTYATVDEWLRDIPGVTVRGSGTAGRQVVTVRGSRPEDVLVLLDGVPLNDAITGRRDLSNLPTSTLESATLLRGASSHRYGSGASAGVLVLSSRRPAGGQVGGALRAESFGGYGLDAYGGVAGERGRLGLSLSTSGSANEFRFENRILPGAPTQVRTNADLTSSHAALTGARGPVQGSIRYDALERGVPGRMGASVFDAARASDRSWQAGLGLAGRQGRVTAGFMDNRLGYRKDEAANEERRRARSLRVDAEWSGFGRVPATVGARLTREGVSGAGIQAEPVRTVWGAHAATVLRAGRLRFDPALAFDVSGSRNVVSPEIGITWLVSKRGRIWGRAGQGFRLPTFGDLYFASAYQVRPNPDLLPERVVLDAELGGSLGTHLAGLRVSGGVTAWYRRTEHPIVWLASSVAVWSPRNLDALESQGLEGQFDLAGSTFAGLGWRLELVGTVQRSRVGFGANRNPLPYEPGSSGRVSLFTWRERTGLRLDLRHTGSRTTSVAATRELPAFTTVDISLTQAIPVRGLDLSALARAENVLDQRFEMIELFPEPGRRLVVRVEARRSEANVEGER